MRILVLSNVPPGAVGGAEMQALHLAARWSSGGHTVTVAGYANKSAKKGNLQIVRIATLRQTRLLRGVTYLASTLWFLWRTRYDFDIIYCRFLKEQAFTASIARAWFGQQRGIVACPANSGFEGDVAVLMRRRLKSVWLNMFDKHLACINTMTNRIKNEVESAGLSGPRISNIPNGAVIIPQNCTHPRKEGKIRIITVARLVHAKGIDILLEAVFRLKEHGHDFAVQIVGDGPLRSSLETLADSLNIRTLVDFEGARPPEEIAERLAASDLFVLPSRHEGFPGSLLEAFAQCLPAVVTRVSGSEDVVDAASGWIVPPDDSGALTMALSEAVAIDRSGLQEMGRAAREKVACHYDMDIVAGRYESLFRELLGKSNE